MADRCVLWWQVTPSLLFDESEVLLSAQIARSSLRCSASREDREHNPLFGKEFVTPDGSCFHSKEEAIKHVAGDEEFSTRDLPVRCKNPGLSRGETCKYQFDHKPLDFDTWCRPAGPGWRCLGQA